MSKIFENEKCYMLRIDAKTTIIKFKNEIDYVTSLHTIKEGNIISNSYKSTNKEINLFEDALKKYLVLKEK